MKKKLTLILAVSVIVSSSFTAFADQVEPIENTIFDQVEEIKEGNDILQAEEIPVEPEEGETQLIQELPNQREMILQLDSTLAWINGEEYTLTARPEVIEGRTYLPLRFMADMLLEAGVDWNPEAKKVTIIKDGIMVEVTIGKQEAHINGDQIQIENTPIIIDSMTYLPLRTTADLFDIQTDYDELTRSITLIKLQDGSYEPEIIKPAIPKFSFAQEHYIAGQPIEAIDESFHEKGRPITATRWMIDFDETKTNDKLANMFRTPRAGSYLVSLKVEAGKGNWSEWETQEITIHPNQKPAITSLYPAKDTYARGELLDFTYTYENEAWEGIKASRWTYRQVGEVLSKAVVEKPQHIFHQGDYIVTLQLQDDYGNWSDAKETIVKISNDIKQHEMEYRFTKGQAGDIIDNFNNQNYAIYKTVESNETSFKAGRLFISNSPENVKENGVLYRDTVSGPGRILVHHHNSFTEEENLAEPKKVVLVAENTSDEPVIFTLSNRADKGPSSDILFVGQQVIYDYLNGSEPIGYSLAPGEKMMIYDSNPKKWEKGQVVSVQMDFNIIGNLTLTTAALGRNAHIDEIEFLPELDRDTHPRGTYDKTDIYHKVHVDNDEPTKLILGAGTEEWVNGYDAITGQEVQNKGGFALNYKIEITATEDTGIMLNPRAGLFRGALKWDGEDAFLAPSKGYFMGHNSKGVMLGVVKAGQTRTLEYSLPNGSASPVLLVFMPKETWKQ